MSARYVPSNVQCDTMCYAVSDQLFLSVKGHCDIQGRRRTIEDMHAVELTSTEHFYGTMIVALITCLAFWPQLII